MSGDACCYCDVPLDLDVAPAADMTPAACGNDRLHCDDCTDRCDGIDGCANQLRDEYDVRQVGVLG